MLIKAFLNIIHRLLREALVQRRSNYHDNHKILHVEKMQDYANLLLSKCALMWNVLTSIH